MYWPFGLCRLALDDWALQTYAMVFDPLEIDAPPAGQCAFPAASCATVRLAPALLHVIGDSSAVQWPSRFLAPSEGSMSRIVPVFLTVHAV